MDTKKILETLPHQPGVYIFKNKKESILYIGKAKDLKKRVSQYFNPNSVRKQEMLDKANTVDFLTVNTESEALYLEDNLIKTHQPPYNNLLKGANSYSYIKITNEAIPRVFITRRKIKDGATYIGPKHNIRELKKLLQYLRQILKFRTCNAQEFNKKGHCSDYYFGLCESWGEKWRANPKQTEEEYQKIIKIITKFFKGNTSIIKRKIREMIDKASEEQHFERAGKLRDIYFRIEDLTEKQTVVLSKNYSGIIFQITPVAHRNILCSINFFEGKIIDIILNKFEQNDSDISQIITLLENEYGKCYLAEEGTIGYQTKKLNKTELTEAKVLLNKFTESFTISSSFKEENIFNDLLQEIQERYQLKNFPYRIECIDISHFGGSWTSGGLSCVIGGLPSKKNYRQYKIKTVNTENNTPDDYLSLKEVIERRFGLNKSGTEQDEEFPNLFILDGGKGQLNVIKRILAENSEFRKIFDQVDFVSLGKGEARKQSNIGKEKTEKTKKTEQTENASNPISEKIYHFNSNFQIESIDFIYNSADQILIKLRNEAHRFSNQYRKKQMSKEWK